MGAIYSTWILLLYISVVQIHNRKPENVALTENKYTYLFGQVPKYLIVMAQPLIFFFSEIKKKS